MSRVPPRVLILTASIGEGHDLPARTLAAQLREERPDVEVVTEDGAAALGRFLRAIMEDAPTVIFYRLQWVWDASFLVFARFPPGRRFAQGLIGLLGSRELLRVVRAARPDVIVSVWPTTTEVLGRLRRSGRLDVPVCAAITDVAALHFWAAPGVDLHLVTHPESIPEVRQVAGAETDVRCVHGFTKPEFVELRDPEEARRSLGLPAKGKVVLVSGGGWGVGDVEGAVETALGIEGVARVVCLCGRNEALRARMQRRYDGDERVRVEGFTERMGDWLAAGDALVHSTGGLTVLEALMRGCPPISYGWGRAHIRLHNDAFRRFGLADVVGSRAELADALRRAIAARRPQDLSFAALPSAASLVLACADGQRADGRRGGEQRDSGGDGRE
jgi:UDP-N-acetylglucosamine:LPS N-acetylglucosamine transferase